MNPFPRSAHRVGVLRRILLLALILVSSLAQAQVSEQIGYVGTYTGKGSQGIYAFHFDAATGEIQLDGLAAQTENPSFLAADSGGQFLYAVNEIDTFKGQRSGAVSVFSIQSPSSSLKVLQQVSSLGSGPAHLSLDRTGKFLLVANYGGGNVAVFPIGPDGQLGNHTAFIQAYGSSVNASRQEAPHAHAIQVTPDNRRAIVADLGTDKLFAYDFDSRAGTLSLDSAKVRAVQSGSGPRHFVITPSGKYLYVVNELTSSVTLFAYDAARGSLEMRQTLSTLPDGFAASNTTAEIVMDAKGRFLYVSNRGDDSIVVFSIDAANGTLKLVQRIPSGGKTPRNIAFDRTGRWLFSANQKSNVMTLFRVNADDGRLTATSQSITVVSPVCVTLVSRH
jgi:6-phosphogluconolactonase